MNIISLVLCAATPEHTHTLSHTHTDTHTLSLTHTRTHITQRRVRSTDTAANEVSLPALFLNEGLHMYSINPHEEELKGRHEGNSVTHSTVKISISFSPVTNEVCEHFMA